MERPIRRDEIPANQEVTLKLIPDIRTVPKRWGGMGDDVFIEWETTGTFMGQPTTWSGASRFTLRDGLIFEEVAYFDTALLRAAAQARGADGNLTAEALAETLQVAGG